MSLSQESRFSCRTLQEGDISEFIHFIAPKRYFDNVNIEQKSK
jgi:hypothetical protein